MKNNACCRGGYSVLKSLTGIMCLGLLLAVTTNTVQAKDEAQGGDATPGKFDWLLQATGYLTHSHLMGASQILGGNGSLVVAPVYQFDQSKAVMLLYNGSYRKSKQIYAQDEGPKLFSEDQSHSVTPTFRYVWSPKFTISPSIFYTEVRTKETSADSWGNGLYNYRDIGGGVNGEYTLNSDKDGKELLTIGLQRYRRKYPNFSSLASMAGIPFEEREKDFDGTLLAASYAKIRAGWAAKSSISILDKNFVDKQVETSTGGRTGDRQHDYVATLGEELSYRFNDDLTGSLHCSVAYTQSNQNLAEGSFPIITFHSDYYDSLAFTIKPGLSYTQKLADERKITYVATYGLSKLHYYDRRAKNVAGTLLSEEENDWTHILTLNAVYALDKHWNIGAIAEYNKASSNMRDEQVYRYNYEILNLSAGFSYRY